LSGELTALHRPPGWVLGRGMEGEKGEKREMEGKESVGGERNERKVEGDKGVERGKKGKERKGRMEGEGRNLVQL